MPGGTKLCTPCPPLPAWLVLPAQPLLQQEEAAGSRGGRVDCSQRRVVNMGSCLSHPRPRAVSISKSAQPKTSSWGTLVEPAQVLSIQSPATTLHHRCLPGEDQRAPGVKQTLRKWGTETFKAAGSEIQQQNGEQSSEMAPFKQKGRAEEHSESFEGAREGCSPGTWKAPEMRMC